MLLKSPLLIDDQLRPAELAFCGFGHLTAEHMRQELHAVADAEHRHPEFEMGLVNER